LFSAKVRRLAIDLASDLKPGDFGASASTLTGAEPRKLIAGVLPNNPENMVRWLRSPQSVSPHSAMPDLGMSDADARDIAAYLASLR
jgi:cytochrome c1